MHARIRFRDLTGFFGGRYMMGTHPKAPAVGKDGAFKYTYIPSTPILPGK